MVCEQLTGEMAALYARVLILVLMEYRLRFIKSDDKVSAETS